MDIGRRVVRRYAAARIGGGDAVQVAAAQRQVQALHRGVMCLQGKPGLPRRGRHQVVLQAPRLALEHIGRLVRTETDMQGLGRRSARQPHQSRQPATTTHAHPRSMAKNRLPGQQHAINHTYARRFIRSRSPGARLRTLTVLCPPLGELPCSKPNTSTAARCLRTSSKRSN
ncbi:hypothetical protein D3C78_1428120 [compost metagenome]